MYACVGEGKQERERDTPLVSAKGALAAVQVIQAKLFLQRHAENTEHRHKGASIMLCASMQFVQ